VYGKERKIRTRKKMKRKGSSRKGHEHKKTDDAEDVCNSIAAMKCSSRA
jgi:inhibitor of KinA sporulation pathway (predicted exonuclease)